MMRDKPICNPTYIPTTSHVLLLPPALHLQVFHHRKTDISVFHFEYNQNYAIYQAKLSRHRHRLEDHIKTDNVSSSLNLFIKTYHIMCPIVTWICFSNSSLSASIIKFICLHKASGSFTLNKRVDGFLAFHIVPAISL